MPSSAAFRTACLLSLICPALPLAAQSSAPAPATEAAALAPLALEDCIARALQKNFDLKIEDFSVLNSKESLNVAKAEFDPTLTASAGHSASQTYGGLSDTRSTTARAGVTQKINSGAIVAVSTDIARNGSSPASSTGSYNPAYNSDLSVSLSQPLLQNAGNSVNRANIERSRIGVDRAGLSYKGQVLQVIRDVETAYYNLAYAREQLLVRSNSLKLAQQLQEEARIRHSTGVATSLDELQADVGVANAHRNVLLAIQSTKDREDALLALIGQFELGTALGSVQFPSTTEQAPNFDLSYKLARENQPDLLSAQAGIHQSEIDAMLAKNGRLPSLDLDAALGYNTRERSFSRAYSELPGSDGYNWQLGLSLRMPWGLKAENARYRSALNTLSQTRTRTQQLEQILMVSVRSSVRSVETNIESVAISIKATELSQEKYRLQKETFSAGKSTALLVLQAQDDLENARLTELQSKVTLRVAVAELQRLEGSSLQRYRVNLP